MYSEDSKEKLFFLLSDVLFLIVTYFILAAGNNFIFLSSRFFVCVFGLLIVVAGIMTDEYSDVLKRGYLSELRKSIFYGIKVLSLFSLVLMFGKYRFINDISNMPYWFLLELLVLSIIFVYTGRCLVKYHFRKHPAESKKALLLTNFSTKELANQLKESKYDVIGYISRTTTLGVEQPVLKDNCDIRDFIAENEVDEIFVDLDAQADYIDEIKYFKLLGIPTSVNVGNYDDYYVGDSVVKKVGHLTVMTTAINIVQFRQIAIKRIIDIFIALLGLILTGIVALIIIPIVKKQSPGPLIFKQKRVGKNGKVFDIYKFRSMYTDAEERKKELLAQNDLDTNLMFKMDNDPRIFPFGQKIRDWSIDELPQFINVLKGDMSVVGTRPPTLDEYKKYEIHHFKRLAAKPGITGLWQVSGRSDITDFEEVVALDMKYIQNWSIAQDIKIIFKTFGVVLKREGSK
ncbi:sugar transferase [Streptococcus henryi]|uniref:sugar transferase n=1 Tax=Streptococcus henryi TaxID=439219 RepID=UPI00037F1007|nr:sugar transferase [Streptococcus henryi]